MVKKRNPKKAEQEDKSISVDELKAMKSSALAIPRKLDDARFDNIPNVLEESHVLVDRFYHANKHLMSPQQCELAKHDFEYFIWMIDLAIQNAAKRPLMRRTMRMY